MNLPKILMRGDEIQILKEVLELDEIIGNGSSRIVMAGGDEIVVKIAFDEKGRTQNEVEYHTWCEFGHTGILAEVFALGQNIIIMERVEELDIEELYNAVDYYFAYDDNFTEEELIEDYGTAVKDEKLFNFGEKISQIKSLLDDMLGTTSDNFQIGETPDGYKSYDFGFISGNYDISVSDTLHEKISEHGRTKMIKLLIQELEWEYNFQTQWEGASILQ